jgi:hypothetical protein
MILHSLDMIVQITVIRWRRYSCRLLQEVTAVNRGIAHSRIHRLRNYYEMALACVRRWWLLNILFFFFPFPHPFSLHCCTKVSPKAFHSILFCALLIQFIPAVMTTSSLHFLTVPPLLLLPPKGLHSVTSFVHPASLHLAMCSAHLHFERFA